MLLRVATTDKALVKRLLLDDVNPGSGKIELSPDCTLTPAHAYQPSQGMRGMPEVMEFVVVAGTNIGFNLIASWLYDLIKNRRAQAELNGKDITAEATSAEAVENLIKSESDNGTGTGTL